MNQLIPLLAPLCFGWTISLNMELDLQSLFGLGLISLAVTSPYYEGAIGQPRQTTSLCDPQMAPIVQISVLTRTVQCE
jgi:hypothetical protein